MYCSSGWANPLNFAYFKLIQYLRKRPERIERPMAWPSPSPATEDPKKTSSLVDIRDFRISSMDGYVLTEESPQIRKTYRGCVLRLFLADRIAMGSALLLEAQRLVLQAAVAWPLSLVLVDVATHAVLYLRRGLTID